MFISVWEQLHYQSDKRPVFVFVLLVAIITLSYQVIIRLNAALHRRRMILINACRPPPAYPHSDPFLGIDGIRAALRAGKEKRFLPRVHQQYAQYGNTFSSRFLTYNVINTIEPANIKSVLATNFSDYEIGSRRKNAFDPLLGKSIGLFDGSEWEHARARLRPSFAKCQIGNLPLYERHFQELLRVVEPAAFKAQPIDMLDVFFRFTADVTTDLMFGESMGSLRDPEGQQADIARVIQEAVEGCELRWQLGPLARFWPQRGFWGNVRVIREYIDPYVRKAVIHRETIEKRQQQSDHLGIEDKEKGENIEGRYNFLREISKLTSDRIILRDELLSLFFGGRDTTACLLSNFLFVVARRPDVWAKIRAAVSKLEGKTPTPETLKEMRYVRFCLLESLRTHTVLPCNSRIAARDTVLPTGGGPNGTAPIFVGKGTMIAYHVTALHKRKDIWGADADEYRPERWQDEKSSWNFLPFNGGPRTCIGQELAMTEASYTIVRLAQHFASIEPRDDRPFTEALSLTYTSANGVKVALKKASF